MVKTENFKQIEISSVADLHGWLTVNYKQEESVWLVTYKKSTPDKYVDRWAVLDELICFGWIDGMRRKLDEHRTMQLISPRRVQQWAKTYKDRAARLTEEGRMHSAGLKSIADAKKAGLWNFMDDVDRLETPTDLKAALEQNRAATDFYHHLADAKKRFALRWLKLAKTQATRKKRIEKMVQHFSKGEKLPGS